METATITVAKVTEGTVEPLSLKDAPSLIERLWPAQKISAEAQKERKAGAGQTLTSLGSYWKGRKPLVLVRACVLGALLPAGEDPEEDLAVFESLMRIDDDAFAHRVNVGPTEIVRALAQNDSISPAEVEKYFEQASDKRRSAPSLETDASDSIQTGKFVWRDRVADVDKERLVRRFLSLFSYAEKVSKGKRPEELTPAAYDSIWPRVNRHLRTNASSLAELVEQLGVMRFGHRPRVGDTFAGGGSIPFEAARIGCDVYASDLNPIACMLTWASLNVIGTSFERHEELERIQQEVGEAVEAEIETLGIERDEHGNQAKAYLYCLEARCPSSGWAVPLLPSLVISRNKGTVAKLVPDYDRKRYEIEIVSGVEPHTMKQAEQGTLRDGYLVHTVDGVDHRNSIKSIRGDFRRDDGTIGNRLRLWEKEDFVPRPDDIFQERLYCIQWIAKQSLGRRRQDTFFAAPTSDDLRRETVVTSYVRDNLQSWQAEGLIPDMRIEPGEKTDEPIRTRGWTYWHHLFGPRHLHLLATIKRIGGKRPEVSVGIAKLLNRTSRLCTFDPRNDAARRDPTIQNVFLNQALNVLYNYGVRASIYALPHFQLDTVSSPVHGDARIISTDASSVEADCDIFITDPPYADAVLYHEITEYFISWLRKNPPEPFNQWTWDSRRALAIKGDGNEFRREMVAAYAAMTEHMPDDGLQIVMFTHQSGSVWADMAQIFWGAGLQVQAAWYIATETTSELKKGGYVQGTVILVLRKRRRDEAGYEDEIAQEVRAEVARQIDTLVGLNQSLKGAGRIENLFEDADLQMAGYAAALRVLTGYTRIDGRDMTAEAVRPRKKGEKGFVERIIEFAVQVANEHMVPEGLTSRLWQQLSGTERFYLKMIDLEAANLKKLDNYQNFARAFRVPDYAVLMADVRPNAAAIKRAGDFKDRTGFDIPDFGQGIVRAALYAIYQLAKETDTEIVMEQLRSMVENYYRRRDDLVEVAEYIATQRGRNDEGEGRFAALLAQLIRNERLG